ncbi:MAG: methionine--tRNA ligase [Peptococcaceae bacterium]|nr:methionine--tRNA ligase [Peptococcaceae bacterium]
MNYYISTPIYYPNASPHIGTAYTTILADAMTRIRRMKGDHVHFLTGTDENSQKIVRMAEAKGVSPQAYVDRIVASFQKLWRELDIANDDFIRTTESRHHRVVQDLFVRLQAQGDIYKSEYKGWYCTPCETFWPESKLVDGRCPNEDCGREVTWLTEESYFFRLSKYQERLLRHLEDNPDFIQPVSRRNEMIKFIEGGLEDLSVSRTSLSWGIKVPGDEKHVVYVWLDALVNYISALGYPDGPLYAQYWPADVHLVGKDIIRFHTVIWPIILMAASVPLPKKVFGHGWFLDREGAKISKSRGNVADTFELIRCYGADAIRYYLLREMPPGQDGTFGEEALVERFNSDLANDFGNFFSRTLAMVERYCEGIVPAPRFEGEAQEALRALAAETADAIEEKLLSCDGAGALDALWQLVGWANRYVDASAPWALARDPEQRGELETVLYTCVECARILGVLAAPFMPGVPVKLLRLFELPDVGDPGLFDSWENAKKWRQIRPGTRVHKGDPLFPRIDLDQVLAEREGQGNGADVIREQSQELGLTQPQPEAQENSPAQSAINPEIDIEDFAKVDLRVVKVLAAERVPKTDKLLKLSVQLGDEERVVVSGIARHYEPEDLVGRLVILVANLKPAKLRGIVSQGMILAASHEGSLEVLSLDQPLPPGAQVK